MLFVFCTASKIRIDSVVGQQDNEGSKVTGGGEEEEEKGRRNLKREAESVCL
jgi:hypothetical protein